MILTSKKYYEAPEEWERRNAIVVQSLVVIGWLLVIATALASIATWAIAGPAEALVPWVLLALLAAIIVGVIAYNVSD